MKRAPRRRVPRGDQIHAAASAPHAACDPPAACSSPPATFSMRGRAGFVPTARAGRLIGRPLRASQVRAATPLKCVCISRTEFEELLGPLQDIIRNHASLRENQQLLGRAAEEREKLAKEAALLAATRAELESKKAETEAARLERRKGGAGAKGGRAPPPKADDTWDEDPTAPPSPEGEGAIGGLD